jgi:hypothetical protein
MTGSRGLPAIQHAQSAIRASSYHPCAPYPYPYQTAKKEEDRSLLTEATVWRIYARKGKQSLSRPEYHRALEREPITTWYIICGRQKYTK